MTTFFLVCAVLGAAVLVLQIVLGLIGLDHEADAPDVDVGAEEPALEEGLDLLGIRPIAAGLAAFGLGGLAAYGAGLPALAAVPLALLPAGAAMVGTAALLRQVMRLESDGSLRVDGALGAPATVYLTIPGSRRGPGKIHVALQGRTVELQAVTAEGEPIPTGAPVIVVSVIGPDTVEVVPTSTIGEILDGTP